MILILKTFIICGDEKANPFAIWFSFSTFQLRHVCNSVWSRQVLSGLDGTSEIQRSVGGLEGQVVDAAFAFNTDAEREAACVWGVPFPSVVGEIAEITA